jgi:hypothetical protein
VIGRLYGAVDSPREHLTLNCGEGVRHAAMLPGVLPQAHPSLPGSSSSPDAMPGPSRILTTDGLRRSASEKLGLSILKAVLKCIRCGIDLEVLV